MVLLRVLLIFGLILSSLASDLYNLNAEVPGLMSMLIKITTTPKPPIHCSKALKNRIAYGKDSTSLKMVNPLPVHAEMFSKKASKKDMSNMSIIMIAASSPAHSHAMLVIIIPCFSLSLSKPANFLYKKRPNTNENRHGINPIG